MITVLAIDEIIKKEWGNCWSDCSQAICDRLYKKGIWKGVYWESSQESLIESRQQELVLR